MATLNRTFFAGMFAGVIFMFLLGVLALAAAILLPRSYLSGVAANRLQAPALPLGSADYEWTITPPGGQPATLAANRGKVLVITLWQPDCGMCLAELPWIQALYEKAGKTNTAFALVAPIPTAAAQNPAPFVAAVQKIATDEGLTVPVYTCASPLPAPFQVPSTPATIIVAPDGQIVLKHVGAAKWDDETVVRFIEGLGLSVGSASE